MTKDNRVAIVTGGGGGLGYATAAALHAKGMRIVLADIDGGAVEAAAERLDADKRSVLAVCCDVTDLNDVQALMERTCEAFGPPYALINNAGIGPLQPFLNITPDLWNQVIGVNLTGT